jgi:hypothetical protein
VFLPEWDFWASASRPLAELRTEYAIPALDPAHAASGDIPDWYHPVA